MMAMHPKKQKSAAWKIALTGTLLLAGCASTSETDESTRDDAGNVVEGGDVGVFALQVGDCFDQELGAEVESLSAIPCADDHELEVYAKFDMPDGDFPGDDVVTAAAEEGCLERFSDYVGIEYADSIYFYTFLSPLEDGWNRIDDREIVCLLTTTGSDPNTGTARNSGI